MQRKEPVPTPLKKQPYRKPLLTTHGDLKTITSVKGGSFFDGGGKPMTRMSGFNA